MSFSILIALLAGLTLLYRVYSHRPTTPSPKTSSPTDPNPSTPAVTKEPPYPHDYLTSSTIFSLEHRAIFSKTWLPLTHTSHFPTPGTYHTFSTPNAPLVVIKSQDSQIRAFHNVCRHRAYPVTRRESGKSTVLACRYHGWSYNTKGELIRAPHFDGVEGFERGGNGLFEVGVWVDSYGVVWVNLEVGREEGSGLGAEALMEGCMKTVGRESFVVGGGKLEGMFNWKIALRERYLMDALGLVDHRPAYSSPLHHVRRYFLRKPESTHFFPNAFIFTIPGARCWLSLSFLPSSESMTSIRYDLYSQEGKEDVARQCLLEKLNTRIKKIISCLEAEYQSCVDTSSDTNQTLTSFDSESIETQNHILRLLKAHTKLEKAEGVEIYPARRESRNNTKYEQAEQLCRELDCGDNKSLAW
ncbi:Rieske [2Fe-2S] iron-sulfur domain-containing protein [Aspergillus karnatakaensis]|uniref:putative iron-sulfur cluster-binding protein n=1 Tax=Aspergillus karnatakaensis TaxID=1810916 RepID=UPI003CCCB3F4